jgi:methylenetetrahydrofolate--tRNA-(uracil-5-)-methyltransferase
MSDPVIIIGAGLAGSEAALVLANEGQRVILYEQKPHHFSGAHKLPGAAELVCSNSFKSLEPAQGAGLLKQELLDLGSPVIRLALENRVPGGKALSVDREKFSEAVTHALKEHPLIELRAERADKLPEAGTVVVASGPLTSDDLIQDILKLCNDQGLFFYDATSPVVSLDSLDLKHFFWASRNQEGDDYLNLPLTKEQYTAFRELILSAEKSEGHLPEEKMKFFEGCLPIEVLAERGEQVLSCSAMKPSGFGEHSNRETYAVIQFRREKAAGELLSMVAFQTRMKWGEQERVLKTLPGMAEANFVRFGVMHRNTFINSPLHLNDDLEFKTRPGLFFAGQITGSEGYTEAVASGHYVALRILKKSSLPTTSAIQNLVRFVVHSDPRYFQPMNFNFGLLPDAPFSKENPRPQGVSAKVWRGRLKSERALKDLRAWIENERSVKTVSNA